MNEKKCHVGLTQRIDNGVDINSNDVVMDESLRI